MMTEPSSRKPGTEPSGPGAPSGALTIVLFYAVFAALWILLSDRAVAWVFSTPAQITLVGTFKGWLFVAITSLLLYLMLRRMNCHPDGRQLSAWRLRSLFWPLSLVALCIVLLTCGAIVHTLAQQKNKEVFALRTIADLKSQQIADWLKERYGEARFIRGDRFWSELYHRWQDEGDNASRDILQSRMEEFRRNSAFGSIQLLNAQGEPIWHTEGGNISLHADLDAAVRRAAGDRQVISSGPYRDAAGHLHLDFVVPLSSRDGSGGPVIVLHVDPEDYMFRTLQAWPVPSASGETLLFRRDGDRVLFLTELRFKSGTAASLRLPIAMPELLTAKVLRGEAVPGSPVEGSDYRGVPVLGVVQAIRGTDWYLIAKLDRAEIVSQAAADILWIILTGLLALFIAVASALFYRQRQELSASLRERRIQAEKLRAMQLLDAIAEASEDAIFAKDLQGRYLLFNREASRITGKQPEEVLGRDDTDIFPPDEARMLMDVGREVMSEGRTKTQEECLTTVSGERVFLATKGPLRDDAGRVIGLFGISRDITERKRVEDLLRHKEMLLRETGQIAKVGGWEFDPQSHEGSWTEETALIHDLDPGTPLTATRMLSFYRGEHRMRIEAALHAAIEKGTPYDLELELVTSKGGHRWVRTICHPVVENGKVVRVRGSIQDITERRRTESELLKRMEAVRQASEGIVITDLDGAITYANPAFEQITGYSAEEAVGHPPRIAGKNDDTRKSLRETMLSGKRWTGRLTDQRRDGTVFTVECSISPVRNQEGDTVHFVWVMRDITSEIRIEERLNQAQKMEAIGTLAGGIAHDFNNILFPLIGYSEMLKDDLPAGSPLQENAHEILHAALRARDLVKQILTVSRQAGQELKRVELQPIIKEALKLLRSSIPSTIRIEQQIDPHCGPVTADPTQVHQIVMNLATNAYHAMEQNGGLLTVSLQRIRMAHDPQAYLPARWYARLTVTDTGVGIPGDILERIFDPYFTTKDKSRGTGLGLSVVQGIVKSSGGDIRVHSEVGKGATFHVYLPLRASETEKTAAWTGEPPQSGTENILLVDDESGVVRLSRVLLEKLGYHVTSYTSSTQALDDFKADPSRFDLVITDMTMPQMTGDRLAQEIIRIRPQLPIIISTGFSETISPEKARAMGIRGFLMKPVIRSDLAAMVRKVLDEAKGTVPRGIGP